MEKITKKHVVGNLKNKTIISLQLKLISFRSNFPKAKTKSDASAKELEKIFPKLHAITIIIKPTISEIITS